MLPTFTPEIIWQLISLAFVFGGVYTAIRKDITNIISKMIETQASVTRAHERIDEHIKDYHRGNH